MKEKYKSAFEIVQKISIGKSKWEDFTFMERTSRDWLRPYLFQLQSRWAFWVDILQTKKKPEAIPEILFLNSPKAEVLKHLKNLLTDYICYSSSVGLSEFLDWLLWGFGEGNERAKISEKVNEYWYKTFNLDLLTENPYDYLGDLMAERKMGRWNNPAGFYATPHPIVQMMVSITMKKNKDITSSVYDPAVGTGRMLLEASNYSLNLFGQDIDYNCVKACKVNGYLYVPWLVKPMSWKSKSVRKLSRIKVRKLSR